MHYVILIARMYNCILERKFLKNSCSETLLTKIPFISGNLESFHVVVCVVT